MSVGVVAAFLLAALSMVYALEVRLWPGDGVEGPIIGQPLKAVALSVDFLAEPLGAVIVVPLLTLACWLAGRRRFAVLAVVAPVAVVALTSVIKPLVGRTIHGEHFAFPSGHTATLTVVGIVVGLLVADICAATRTAAVGMTLGGAAAGGIAMGWAQTVLSAHYLTDTVGGFCAALVVVPCTAWLIDSLASRRR